MNLGNSYLVWSCGCSMWECPLYRLHVLSAFSGRAGFNVDTSHNFPQGVLAAITLVGDGTANWGARGRTFPLLSGCHCSVGCRVWSQVAGAETLRVVWELPLFHLCVCFPLSQHQNPSPRGRKCCNKGGSTGSLFLSAKASSLSCLWCATFGGASNYFPRSTQTEPQVQVSFVPHSWSLPSAPAAPTLLWHGTAGQALAHVGFGLVSGVWAMVDQLPSEFWAASEAPLE